MRAAYSPKGNQLPALLGLFILNKRAGLPSRDPGKGRQLICTQGERACIQSTRSDCQPSVRGSRVCPQGHVLNSDGIFRWQANYLVLSGQTDFCLHEGLWITDHMLVSGEPLWTTQGQVRANYRASQYF